MGFASKQALEKLGFISGAKVEYKTGYFGTISGRYVIFDELFFSKLKYDLLDPDSQFSLETLKIITSAFSKDPVLNKIYILWTKSKYGSTRKFI